MPMNPPPAISSKVKLPPPPPQGVRPVYMNQSTCPAPAKETDNSLLELAAVGIGLSLLCDNDN